MASHVVTHNRPRNVHLNTPQESQAWDVEKIKLLQQPGLIAQCLQLDKNSSYENICVNFPTPQIFAERIR